MVMTALLLAPLSGACDSGSTSPVSGQPSAKAAAGNLAALDEDRGPPSTKWLALEASHGTAKPPRIGEDAASVKARLPLEDGQIYDLVVKQPGGQQPGWRLHNAYISTEGDRVKRILLHSTGAERCKWMRQQLEARYGPPSSTQTKGAFLAQWRGRRVAAEYKSMSETSATCYVSFSAS